MAAAYDPSRSLDDREECSLLGTVGAIGPHVFRWDVLCVAPLGPDNDSSCTSNQSGGESPLNKRGEERWIGCKNLICCNMTERFCDTRRPSNSI